MLEIGVLLLTQNSESVSGGLPRSREHVLNAITTRALLQHLCISKRKKILLHYEKMKKFNAHCNLIKNNKNNSFEDKINQFEYV